MRINKILKSSGYLFAFLVILTSCAERKITIRSNPPDAIVLVDGQKKGVTPSTFNFTFYGTREITLQKEGYQTLKTSAKIKAPFMHIFPFDLLMLLVPYPITDHHVLSYQLQLYRQQDEKKLMKQAEALKIQLKNELSKHKK